MTQTFSIEAVVLGRNDNYEPNWLAKLYASIAYNRALFEGSNVDFRVVFVEWNPPPENPLISPDLVKTFDYVRAIVVDADVHDRLCTADNLAFMLNHSYNCAIRTSPFDFQLITGGDIFLGRALVEKIKRQGLEPGRLYRAERVNIRADIDFTTATADVLEDPDNIVSVNFCDAPPYDTPPYTHACGDFMMVDRATMNGLRGYDESISFARLHLDSRFARNTMIAELGCELLGRIYHINHTNSFINRQNDYPGKSYDYNADMPYLNPLDWGLHSYLWTELGERLWQISLPDSGRPADGLTGAETTIANDVLKRLAEVKSTVQPPKPSAQIPHEQTELDIASIRSEPHWEGAAVRAELDQITITTIANQWGYSAVLPLADFKPADDHWTWLELSVETNSGEVGISALAADQLVGEHYVKAGNTRQTIAIALADNTEAVMFRNVSASGASVACVYSARIIQQKKMQPSYSAILNPLPA